MGYLLTQKGLNAVFKKLSEEYILIAPKRFYGGGRFSDAAIIRYGEIHSVGEIVFDEKSSNSFKEAILPASQTLFYFTEKRVKEADKPDRALIDFLRSCDIHASIRLDEIYLRNGGEDYYYKQRRDNIRFVLMGCSKAFENCFCVDMGTNRSAEYDMSIDSTDSGYLVDCRFHDWGSLLAQNAYKDLAVTPSFVTDTKTRVSIPNELPADVMISPVDLRAGCL